VKVGDLVYNQSIETWGMITKIEDNFIKGGSVDYWIRMYCFDNGSTEVASNLEIQHLTNTLQNKS
jgi:hypothetical protein|tara:strand:+ start:119 stop:313 length:195 start_codon:yes stop_codon:yes gene_type:complete